MGLNQALANLVPRARVELATRGFSVRPDHSLNSPGLPPFVFTHRQGYATLIAGLGSEMESAWRNARVKLQVVGLT
jgi:hypothetical protein